MATKRDKKPWQFSLGRAMVAMTLICVTLAGSGALFSTDGGGLVVVVVLMGFCSAFGVVVGGIKGAAIGAMVGLAVSCPIFILLAAWTLSSM